VSYARFGMRCDVYVFLAVEGHLECCSCSIEGTARRRTTAGMLARLDGAVPRGPAGAPRPQAGGRVTLDEARAAVGRRVVFTYFHGEQDAGVVTSVNDKNVFVRFGAKAFSEACDPDRLALEVPWTG
jgi:hypothetical protein